MDPPSPERIAELSAELSQHNDDIERCIALLQKATEACVSLERDAKLIKAYQLLFRVIRKIHDGPWLTREVLARAECAANSQAKAEGVPEEAPPQEKWYGKPLPNIMDELLDAANEIDKSLGRVVGCDRRIARLAAAAATVRKRREDLLEPKGAPDARRWKS